MPRLASSIVADEPTASPDVPSARPRRRRSDASPARSSRLSRAVWRWHFYAGVITSPILIVVTLTGLLFIFSPEIERYWHRDRLFVTPGSSRMAASALVETAARSHPGWTVSRLAIEPAEDRSVVVSLADAEATRTRDIYIDPYRGEILADVDPANDRVRNFFQLVLEIHRTLFIGATGRVLVELATCWSILLMLTGIYLWWPRRWNVPRGVWLPRLRAKPYTVQRDLHTVVGIYALPLLLLISLTGMFYTIVWGKGAVAASVVSREGVSGLSDEPAGNGERQKATKPPPIAPRYIDESVRIAARACPERSLGLDLANASATSLAVHTLDDYAVNSRGPFESETLTINPSAGTIVKREPLAENAAFWWHRWVYPLHVGSFWGLPTKILWAVGCLVLIGLPITGLWMWWIRRPKGRTGIPHRPPVKLPYWILGLVALACVLFPVAGGSVLAFIAAEWFWDRARSRKRLPTTTQ